MKNERSGRVHPWRVAALARATQGGQTHARALPVVQVGVVVPDDKVKRLRCKSVRRKLYRSTAVPVVVPFRTNRARPPCPHAESHISLRLRDSLVLSSVVFVIVVKRFVECARARVYMIRRYTSIFSPSMCAIRVPLYCASDREKGNGPRALDVVSIGAARLFRKGAPSP